ncbi:hypothetical protein [Actinomadura bangladeshensis]|uniref:Uncharacterized protein n=1 Tax=Actinomadura bangladeshensis TaxID=453573 RepID=A0A6L9QWN1_9ACTN|nr:hypothetical protein [Actinomadura bangladeshensis]NEA29488.1 hypothetical protein [Actinomadura bangladeshensis]
MRDATAWKRRPERRPANRPTRWGLLAVNSAFFLIAVGLLNTSQQDTTLVALGRVATCAPIGPVASRYVDKDKVCRRSRKEVMKSLRTGRDPDWNAVIRNSMKKPSERHRGHGPPKSLRHQTKKHQNSPPSSDASPAVPPIRPTSRTETEPPPAVPSAAAPSKPSEHVPTPTPTSHTDLPHRPPWRAAAIALLAFLAVAAYLVKRRRTAFLATRSLLSHMKRGSQPKTETTSIGAAGCMSPDEDRVTSLLTKGASLTGPEAEDAARHMAMEILNRRHHNPADLVLSRPDAWQLFGTDIGTLQEDRVPGLILTDDAAHTRALLGRQCLNQCIAITYADEAEELRELPHQRQPAIVSLKAPTGTTKPPPANPPPRLSRSDAFNELMSMPTIARHPTQR